ncbi:hypothetical protein TNCV_3450251 [Trichonephila clavipes]|uniref:Uncharacterized protein n=1 Tax=Trichonephila clavipes TaxID=2585209 RepID=A0A8X6WJJ9_TRICX|nr:hypothetical protein TNCV_3450251 [Trichonephila clavipes]
MCIQSVDDEPMEMTNRTLSWVTLGPLALVEGTVKAVDNLRKFTNQLNSYMTSVFHRKWNLPAGQRPMSKD